MNNFSTSIQELPPIPSPPLQQQHHQPAQQQQQQQQQANGSPLDESTIRELVQGLQEATSTGVTQLVSRDISTNAESITHDEHIKPNYIPPQQPTRYIPETRNQVYHNESSQQIVQQIVEEDDEYVSNEERLSLLYDEIQNPLFVGLLFFLFQMPIVRLTLFKTFPDLFHADGNVNLYGIIFMSTCFAMVYNAIMKLLHLF
jgi:hypothetical protein